MSQDEKTGCAADSAATGRTATRAAKREQKNAIKSVNKDAELPRGWRLLMDAWRDWRANWKMFTGIAAVVAVPLALVSLASGATTTESGFDVYSIVFGIGMNSAVLYAVIRLRRDGERVSVREAYYDGSALITRCTLVALALGAMLLPLGLAVNLYNIVSYSSLPAELAPIILSGLAVAIIALVTPTIWLLTRFAWGFYVCAWEGLRPMASLRRGRALTLGRFWRVLGRLATGLAVTLLVFIIVAVATIPSGLFYAPLADTIFNLVVSIVVLPIAVLFLSGLYRALAGDSDVIEAGLDPAAISKKGSTPIE